MYPKEIETEKLFCHQLFTTKTLTDSHPITAANVINVWQFTFHAHEMWEKDEQLNNPQANSSS